MRKKFFLTSSLILSVILTMGVLTKPVARAQGVDHEDVLIGFKEFPGKSEEAHVKNIGGNIKYTYHLVPVIAASVPSTAVKGLKHNPNVTYVEEDGDVFLASELTDSWGVDRIDADVAWDTSTGAGIHISIIDTGIDKDHPDLVANIAGGVNFVSTPGKGKGVDPDAYDDDHGHGSHCAGIAAADDNGSGVVGVAPDAWLYGVKVLDRRGRGKASDFIAGIEWSVDGPDGIHGTPDDAEIISISLRYFSDYESITAACDAASAAGLLLVSSAGNTSGGGVTFPANLPSVLAVSATDEYDNIAGFSADGPEVELAAPGVDVYSTYRNGGYTTMSGTSMSCPHVAGVAALVWATGYYANGNAVRFQLNRTAEWLEELTPEQQGNGLVDAEAAIAYPEPGFNVVLSMDKESYLEGTTEPAILTAVVSDELGSAVAGLEAFETILYDDLQPDILIPAVVNFTETEIGTYTGELDISSLGTGGDDYRGFKVEVIVTSAERSGADEIPFHIVAASGGALWVDIQTNKTVYSIGERVYITVTVTDDYGDPIEGARVYAELRTASGKTYFENQYTDAAGAAEFMFKTKNPDGKGTYTIYSFATMSGYMTGEAYKDIIVQ